MAKLLVWNYWSSFRRNNSWGNNSLYGKKTNERNEQRWLYESFIKDENEKILELKNALFFIITKRHLLKRFIQENKSMIIDEFYKLEEDLRDNFSKITDLEILLPKERLEEIHYNPAIMYFTIKEFNSFMNNLHMFIEFGTEDKELVSECVVEKDDKGNDRIKSKINYDKLAQSGKTEFREEDLHPEYYLLLKSEQVGIKKTVKSFDMGQGIIESMINKLDDNDDYLIDRFNNIKTLIDSKVKSNAK